MRNAGSREGIRGWVRNLPDGRVEILADGDTVALARFERLVREGPPASRVDEVHCTEIDQAESAGPDAGRAESGDFRVR